MRLSDVKRCEEGRLSWLLAVLILCGGAEWRAQAGHGVAAGNVRVVQVDGDNTTASVRASLGLGLNGFQVANGSTKGDFYVQIGDSLSDDTLGGVLMSSVAENGRNNFGTNNYPISTVNASTGYRICAFVPTAATSGSATEYNVNVAGAWFPYGQFLGGLARNSGGANGGTNDLFTASPGLVLGTHFRWVADGQFVVDLRSRGIDSRTSGVLLVSGGKDENNFALSQVNATDGTWNVFLRDNAQPTYGTYEQDPVAFVFVPKTNTALISGRFNGDGSIAAFSGASAAFTVKPLTNIGVGRWELKIPGYTPDNGVLIISAEGGGTYNGDNIVSYQANAAGDGWEIQSRDTPNNGLQTPVGPSGAPEAVATFVFIPGPTITPVSPAANSVSAGASPLLQVAVTNTPGIAGDVQVTFWGREGLDGEPGPDFTIVALPDTQYYTAARYGGVPEMFIAQTEWVVTNRVSRNIAYVAHLGDISDSGDIKGSSANTTEWRNATNAMYRLDNPLRTLLTYGVPYGLAVGNHDAEPINSGPMGTSIFYNQYFGISHFNGRPYYGGHYGTNNNNHFDFFSASGMDFIVLYFDFDTNATPAVLKWGNEVLRTNANRRAIMVTHYLGTPKTPTTFSSQAQKIYTALRTNANLFLMLGGHVDGEGSRTDTFNGRTVHSLVSDYQFYTNGGNGLMRVMEFSPKNNTVTVQTYSPWTGQYETDDDSEFYFPYNMQVPSPTNATPFSVLGTNTGAGAGAVVSCTWPGLTAGKVFQWYVTVTDAEGNTATSPAWQFTTGPNTAPVASNRAVTIPGDMPAELQLLASDANGDALTFRTNSFPTRGQNIGFDTNHGIVTYLPARGFRGSDRFTYQANDGSLSSGVATMNINVQAPADTNANALPDAWEAAYGITDPNADDDGDGVSNLAEYWANTNPTNAASALRVLSAGWQNANTFRLTWSSVGGTRYRVQVSDSFDGAPTTFTDVVRDLATEMDASAFGTTSTQTFTETISSGANTNRYYRVKVTP